MSIHPSTARRLVAILLSMGVLFVAGCGDDDTSAADPSSPDPSIESTTADGGDTGNGDSSSAEEAAGDEPTGEDLPDACGLVDQAEVEALIGPAAIENEAGQTLDGLDFNQCVWESDESGQLIGVALTSTTTRFESHLDNLPGDPVDGLGDDAITAGGVSLETTGATGGRTISMANGDRTVVVALRLDGQTTLDAVRPLAESVLANLAD